MAEPIRVAIAGAGGRIGYSLVFRIANGGLFGHDQPIALSLLELPDALPRLEACAMELRHWPFPLLADLRTGSDPLQMFAGADWAILAGASRFAPRFACDSTCSTTMRRSWSTTAGRSTGWRHCSGSGRRQPLQHQLPDRHVARTGYAAEPLVRAQPGAPHAGIGGSPKRRGSPSLRSRGSPSGAITVRPSYVDLRNTRIHDRPALDVISDADWIRRSSSLPSCTAHGRSSV